MNKKVLKTLEYDKIISILKGHASTADGKRLCEKLKPSTDIEEIKTTQQQTSDAFARVMRNGSISFSGARNLSAAWKRLEIGGVLNQSELLSTCSLLTVVKRACKYDSAKEDTPKDSLSGYFGILDPLPELAAEISRCILSEDEISDDASPTLRQIRRQMLQVNDKIRSQLNTILNQSGMQTYLQDHVITMRGDRYCLPVKSEYRSQVPGMIHDQSSTGSTVFIEPAAIVKLNNDLKELTLQEEREIEAILAALSALVAAHISTLQDDFDAIIQLDFIFAKAYLAEAQNATMPIFHTEHRIHLRKARHPLLDPARVVPIDLPLGENYHQLILTGPNTGGKTVSLKTIGLLSLMGQAGLHIPAADRSELSVFHDIFADIGDEQSIEQSLSTFSSHMTNIVYILKHANADSLVLFDELCAGTDPTEGAALAISILSRLREQGIRTMATTHYSELKVYALSTDSVENACCEFDVDTLSPTYRLLIGIPGRSNAFAISRKLGLDASIIEIAREQMNQDDEAFEDLLSDLETRRVHIEEEELEIQRLRQETERLQQRLDQQSQKTDEMREKILSEARAEANQLLQEAKKQADESIRNINKYGSLIPDQQEAVKSLEKERAKLRGSMNKTQSLNSKKKETQNHNYPDPKSLRIGDSVKVLTLNMKGTVHTLPDNKGNLTVQMGILQYKVNVRDLLLLKEPSETEKYGGSKRSIVSSKVSSVATVSTELNLIGKNSDDAIASLDKYLDEAYVANLPSVRIVHGKGSGALRKAVQNHLKTLRYVKSYHLAEYGEGDSGVTIVEFD